MKHIVFIQLILICSATRFVHAAAHKTYGLYNPNNNVELTTVIGHKRLELQMIYDGIPVYDKLILEDNFMRIGKKPPCATALSLMVSGNYRVSSSNLLSATYTPPTRFLFFPPQEPIIMRNLIESAQKLSSVAAVISSMAQQGIIGPIIVVDLEQLLVDHYGQSWQQQLPFNGQTSVEKASQVRPKKGMCVFL